MNFAVRCFHIFSLFHKLACGSDLKEKCLFSLTLKPLKCRLSVTSYYNPNAATGPSGCFALDDWLGEQWYVKWRERVCIMGGKGMSSGVGVGAAESTHHTGICCTVKLLHSCVCGCAFVCVCVSETHALYVTYA